jgi:hypothetical protein
MIPVLLMADYYADPLWHRSPAGKGAVMISLDSLPLSAELKIRLRKWAQRFDELMETDYEWPSDAEAAAWVAEGQALLEPLRHELGDEYDVTYFHGDSGAKGRA